jgi:subtilisin family serine protease
MGRRTFLRACSTVLTFPAMSDKGSLLTESTFSRRILSSNRLTWLVMLAAMAFPALALAASVPGELIIKLRHAPRHNALDQIQSAGVSSVDGLVSAQRATVTAPLAKFAERFTAVKPVVLLRTEPALNLDSLQAVIASDPNVEWVTQNYLYRDNGLDDGTVPNDSLYSDEWWLNRVSAPAAWEITHGDSNVVIGIIDTGVDYLHPDLRPNLWHNWAEVNGLPGVDDDGNGFVDDSIGWDFVDAPELPSSGDHLVRDSDPMDEFGHGTFVAGIAAAATNNGECIASVGYNCRIMPLRAGNAEGFLEEDDIAAALLYGAEEMQRTGIRLVINMSFGDVVASPLLRETVQLAYQAGVTLVASAGNAASPVIHYPSGYPEVISVGATDHGDFLTSFSNYGPSVTVMAPGLDFSSTILGGGCGPWGSSAGTSYAAPIVSAVAALVLSVNPSLAPNDVKQIIRTTADDVRDPGWDPQTVSGRVNARHAVEQAIFGSEVVSRITSPRTDDGLLADFVVRGEAWGSAFSYRTLSTGIGENPAEWSVVTTGNVRVFGDSLGFVQLPPMDTVMTLRLSTIGTDGAVSEDFVHLFIQRTAPRIDSMHNLTMLDGDTYGKLVQVWTNQMTGASMLLTNAQGDSVREDFGYVSREHAGVLSQREHPGAWQVRVRVTNTAGLSAYSDPFTFEVNEPPFTSNLWTRTETNLGHGYYGTFSTDFNCDGQPELWLLPIGHDNYVGSLVVAQWNGEAFSAVSAAPDSVYIPQDVGDANHNGLKEFMGRRSNTTRIWEQTDSCGPFNHLVFEDTSNFTCTEFLDLDPTDNHGEILAWRYTGASGVDRPRYIIFSVGPGYSLTAVDTLPNLTAGSNNLGSPKVLIGDLNRNGELDFVYGDYDGDLIFCERRGGRTVQKWSKRLPLDDATSWLAKGDLDGDGEDEFVAGCRTAIVGGTESQMNSLHWEYFVFKHELGDSFAVMDTILIQGNAPVSDHPASVNVADVDGDGIAEILISAFPDYYIIKRDPVSGRYKPVWYQTPSESNTSFVADWNHDGINEIYESDGNRLQRIEYAGGAGTRPHPPLNFAGEPLGLTSIRLSWNRAADADSYRVYRTGTVPYFNALVGTSDTMIVLSDVDSNVTFNYAVASVNGAFADTISVLSNYAQVTAHQAATVADTAHFVSPHFVELRFSAAMGPSSMYQWVYHLDDGRMPAVVSPGEGGRQVYLTFDGGFTPGPHSLTLSGLRDALDGRLANGAPVTVSFNVIQTVSDAPHILTHRILGATPASTVEITFSDPMSVSVSNPGNYSLAYERDITTVHNVLSIEVADSDRHRVSVHLDPRYPVGALGLPARLFLRNITNETGIPLDTAAGQADLLLGGAAESLSGAYVFPNPYKGNGAGGEPGVMFASLPERATIRVFTLRGTLVRTIDHNNASGASRWDLDNDRGEAVAGGVYLYTIESNGTTVRGKLAVLR